MNRKYCECKLTSSRASASSIRFNKNLIEVLSAENRTWHSGATQKEHGTLHTGGVLPFGRRGLFVAAHSSVLSLQYPIYDT